MIKTKYKDWYFESGEEDFSFQNIKYKNEILFTELNFCYPENKKLKKVKYLLEKNHLEQLPIITKMTKISRMELPNHNKYKLDERLYSRINNTKFDFKRKIEIQGPTLLISWSIQAPISVYNNTSFKAKFGQLNNFTHHQYHKERWQRAKIKKIDIIKKKHWQLGNNDYLEFKNRTSVKLWLSNSSGFLQENGQEIICSPKTNGKPREILKSFRIVKNSWYLIAMKIQVI